ncbi:MAG: ABC transporter substrate-binding protein [Rhizobiaceae bacterium]|nr:ABC transporter substrate-binding protein [Rhizobiaceae bacterium]
MNRLGRLVFGSTLAAPAALFALSALGGSAAQAEDTVTVGFPVALSGFVAPYDDGPRKAALLAIDDINAKGGLLGKKIVTVEADTKSDPGQGATAATEVLSQGAKMVMVTCDFDFGAPAALVAESQNVIAFSSCAADPKFGVQGIGKNAYTMSTTTISQGSTLADWAFKESGFKTVYLLKDTMVEYTKSLCDSFETRWTELAGADSIVGRDTFHGMNDTSIAGQISRLKATDPQPDFVMFCGAINGASAVRQIRAAGINLPLVASESMDGAYWLESVPNLSDFYVAVYGSVFGNDPEPAVNDFVKRFTEKFGAPPVTGHALTGYSVIEAWAKAVERANSFDTDAVRAELDKFNGEQLLIGKTSFSPELHINVDRPMLVMKIVDGKHEPVGRFVTEKLPEIKF